MSMKILRIVRSEGTKELIKFIELSEDCSQKEFSTVLQYLFGNTSTTGATQVLCDLSGQKTAFSNLESGKTYFITFEKKEFKSLITWENPEMAPITNSSRLRVLDQSEYFTNRIAETKSLVKDKATDLIIKQEDFLLTIKQSLSKIHGKLGAQSLQVLDYSSKTNSILNKIKNLTPLLQQSIKDLKETNNDLKMVYSYKPPPQLINKEKKRYLDPRIVNYMKKFSYKDLPVNELTPGEMKRFMKFQMISENQITPLSSQNTPSGKKKFKGDPINISSPFSKKS